MSINGYSYNGRNWVSASGAVRMNSDAFVGQQKGRHLDLTVGGQTIKIPKRTITETQLGAICKVLEGLTLSEATTGPSQAVSGATKEGTKAGPTQTQINEALGKIYTIIGEHPHLGNEFSEEIWEALHPETAKTAAETGRIEDAKAALDELKDSGLVREDGTIDFSKLEGLTSRDLQKANLSGKMWIDDTGFHMEFTGNCGDETFKVLEKLKERVNGAFSDKNLNGPITLNPEDAKAPDPTDMAVLGHGGQIQFKSLPNGKTLKLILDPGKDGKDDGLTVEIWHEGNRTKWTEDPIPLKYVFEGQAYHDHRVQKDGHPILGDWRTQEWFKKSVVHTEKDRIIPFTARFDRVTANNTDDPGRIQAQNTLWNAVWTYLGATLQPEEEKEASKVEAPVGEVKEKSTPAGDGAPAGKEKEEPTPAGNGAPAGKGKEKPDHISASKVQVQSPKGKDFSKAVRDFLDAIKALQGSLVPGATPSISAEPKPQPSKIHALDQIIRDLERAINPKDAGKQRLLDSTKTVVTALREALQAPTPENMASLQHTIDGVMAAMRNVDPDPDMGDLLLQLAKKVSLAVDEMFPKKEAKVEAKEVEKLRASLIDVTLPQTDYSDDIFLAAQDLVFSTCQLIGEYESCIPILQSMISKLGFEEGELKTEQVPELSTLTNRLWMNAGLKNGGAYRKQLASYLQQKIVEIQSPQETPSQVGEDLQKLMEYLRKHPEIFPKTSSQSSGTIA